MPSRRSRAGALRRCRNSLQGDAGHAPCERPAARLSQSLCLARACLRFPVSRDFRDALRVAANERFDAVHFNHEALFLLARWLRPRTRVPFTMHIRTNLVPSPFSRWQARTIARSVDHAVFITENEQRSWQALGLRPPRGSVIYNIAGSPAVAAKPHP